MSRSISIAAALVLLFGCASDQLDTGTPPAAAGVTDLIGQRVILSYGMPISSEGTPGHLPKADDTTRCSVVGAGGDLRESSLPYRLEDYTVIVPIEMEPFRKEGMIGKGVRRVLYEPKGVLFHRRLTMILDSRGKLRQLDFWGGLRIDPAAKTISLVLPETSEQKQTQPDVQPDREDAAG
jgi:hypothetical protein